MAIFSSCSSSEGGADKMREVFGPGQVDQAVRSAIQMCWWMLPAEKRNSEEVETQIRRILERALKDMREDQKAFGF
jgi:hypothetical protein